MIVTPIYAQSRLANLIPVNRTLTSTTRVSQILLRRGHGHSNAHHHHGLPSEWRGSVPSSDSRHPYSHHLPAKPPDPHWHSHQDRGPAWHDRLRAVGVSFFFFLNLSSWLDVKVTRWRLSSAGSLAASRARANTAQRPCAWRVHWERRRPSSASSTSAAATTRRSSLTAAAMRFGSCRTSPNHSSLLTAAFW